MNVRRPSFRLLLALTCLLTVMLPSATVVMSGSWGVDVDPVVDDPVFLDQDAPSAHLLVAIAPSADEPAEPVESEDEDEGRTTTEARTASCTPQTLEGPHADANLLGHTKLYVLFHCWRHFLS